MSVSNESVHNEVNVSVIIKSIIVNLEFSINENDDKFSVLCRTSIKMKLLRFKSGYCQLYPISTFRLSGAQIY